MNLVSRLVERMLDLPPPLTRDVLVARDLAVPMRDGVTLLADRWYPKNAAANLPVVLLRSPYGRRGIFGSTLAKPLAERGFQVLIQSTRAGFGSGGAFDPLKCEREDGLATLDWLVKQPWCIGASIVLAGGSYLGYVQWAVADRAPPQVKAMLPQVTESALTLEFLRKDGFSLETPFGWGVQMATQERPLAAIRALLLPAGRIRRAPFTVPLRDADVAAMGQRSDYVQDILVHDRDSPRWAGIDHSDRVASVTVPVSSIGGWYDIFLPGQLRDFRTLVAAGRDARLTIGPWTHTSLDQGKFGMREVLEFGLAHARGERPPARAPVRLYVMGEEAWRDFESWPPAGYAPRRFYLQADRALSADPPAVSEPDRYRYDPFDPTPAVGGVRIAVNGIKAGRVDNAALEARPDVLTYTAAVLEHDVEIVGDVRAEIWFQSTLRHADVFVRLCDVDPRGRSWNVCDGLVSLTGSDQVTRAQVQLWPTAYRFKRGHRVRVQVSSGAFPRYNRNSGTGEPRATATTLLAADQRVFHDPAHPSAISLPVKS
jgi:putative CocE/NonD family hydrolase